MIQSPTTYVHTETVKRQKLAPVGCFQEPPPPSFLLFLFFYTTKEKKKKDIWKKEKKTKDDALFLVFLMIDAP